MLTKYKIDGQHTARIEVVQVTRETAHSVFFLMGLKGERCEPKHTNRCRYFDTWESAYAVLIQRAESKLADADRDLQLARSFYDSVNGLRKPAVAA